MLTAQILETATKIGHFHVYDGTMTFNRVAGMRAKDIKALGDVVYFMFVDGKLMKIGKAGGANGFVGRAGTYNRGRLGDATNNLIIDVMESLHKTEIEVFAFSVPRHTVQYDCPLTGQVLEVEVSIHKDIEKLYTDLYLMEDRDNELPFCNQLS